MSLARRILLPWQKHGEYDHCYIRHDIRHKTPVMMVISDSFNNEEYRVYYFDNQTMKKSAIYSFEEAKDFGDIKAKELGYRCLEDKHLVIL